MSEPRVAVVIEDQADLRELTELVLTQSGYTVVTAADGPSGIEAVREHEPLITTLDVNMPGMDGFAVAKQLREFSETYLIMITARSDEIDIVMGFEAGADDYIVKPFSPRELRARADSMLRRPRRMATAQGGAPAAAPEPEPETWVAAAARELRESPLAPMAAASVVDMAAAPAATLDPPAPGVSSINGLTLDPATGLTTLGGRRVDLSEPERELLASLMSTGRRVRSKADLVLALRGQPYVTSYFVKEIDKKNVDGHIASLRSKLGDDAATPRFIETVSGVGYRMALAS